MESSRTGLEIAVIGMAGRFPGANDINRFWENLKIGIESISFFSDQELEEVGVESAVLKKPNYIKAYGVMTEFEMFDAFFFGYTPKEAEMMDPQTRIFHECVWTALEDAGYTPGSPDRLIGLYAGATPNFSWEARSYLAGKSNEVGGFESELLIRKDFLCLRISYKLNLIGPSFVLYTACSTSLVAIHLACQAILNGECDMALAGGVTIGQLKNGGYLYEEGMVGSPDGHCKAFDQLAKGTVGGSGAAVVVLKRFEDAIGDGDYIHAVVKGSAINNDGVRKAGFTAPSIEGQAEVIKMALQMAEVEADTIGFIETHGTGTELGDPVEIEALKLGFNTVKKGFCGIGAVKTNVGHLDSAAGVTGFIKTILALKHKIIPPSLHFQVPNPEIAFIESPFYVSVMTTSWETGEYPRRAGVSSFGIGGTNAHVILEEALLGNESLNKWGNEPVRKDTVGREYQLILLSAKTQTALDKMLQNLADYFKSNPQINFAHAVYTLLVGRKSFKYRWMAVCSSVNEAIDLLTTPGAGESYTLSLGEESTQPETVVSATDKQTLLQIGRLWLKGKEIDWNAHYSGKKLSRISLPTYPFETQRFWIDEDSFRLVNSRSNRDFSSSHTPGIADWLYLPSWKRSFLEKNLQKNEKNHVAFRWLVFATGSCLSNRLVKELKEKYQDVVIVEAGEKFSQTNAQNKDMVYTINPRESQHYRDLFTHMCSGAGIPDKILHLWNLSEVGDNATNDQLTVETFDKSQYLGFYSVFYMVKAIGIQNVSKDIDIIFMTTHTQEVVGGEHLSPEKTPVLALLKAIPQEYPGINCCSIDILPPEPRSNQEKSIIQQLMEELIISPPDRFIAYRNNHRWVQFYEPLHLGEELEEKVKFQEQGVYLLTGGVGDIGLMFAELLVKNGGARLILTGRSPFPPKEKWGKWLETHEETDSVAIKIKKLMELEEMGGKVLYLQADAANRRQMRDIVTRAEQVFGEINGVFHAAGIISGRSMQPIENLSPADCQPQFQAKVYGLIILNELFEDKQLDFFWVMSSISCVLAGLGLSVYASANMFMDAFVKKHNQLHASKWLTLNWDGMEPALSITLFKRLFALKKVDQVVSSKGGKLQERINKWIKLESVRKKTKTAKNKPTGHPRPELSTPYEAPANPVEESIAHIWKSLFGFNQVGVHDDFLELGGDSLKSITIISRIHQELNVNIPLTEYFSRSTIRELAEYISKTENESTFLSIKAWEKKEYYPLSSAQKRIYIIYQMTAESRSYNIPTVIRIDGECQPARLTGTFKQLIKRHEGLRTSFTIVNETPVQRVHDEVEFKIEYSESEEEIKKISGNFIRPFDLAKAPLLRVGLVKIREDAYIFMVDMYHIISDAISYSILVTDFLALYNQANLVPLKIQYKDFSEWQNQLIKYGEMDSQKEFWMSRFKDGNIPISNIPLDFPRPPVRNVEAGDQIHFNVEKELYKKLCDIMREVGATSFMILSAVFITLLAKYTKQEDVVVGTLVTGRTHVDMANLLGIFVNTLPIRNFPGKNKTFKEFLEDVKANTLAAFENQDYSFDELVMELGLQGELNQNPLFNTVFTMSIFDFREVETDVKSTELTFSIQPSEQKFAKFDIYFEVSELKDRFVILIRYSTELFKLSTIQKMADYYIEILEQVVENIKIQLRNITLSHEFLITKSSVQRDDGGDFNL